MSLRSAACSLCSTAACSALALALLLSASAATAQAPVPPFLDAAPLNPKLVTPHLDAMASGPLRVGADGRGTLTVVVTPRARMHVYAADVDGYVPFTVKIAAPAGTAGRITYPKAETYVFPPTGETSRVYMKPFEVTHAITLAAEVRKALDEGRRVNGVASLRYQACDDTVCYRPTTGSFVFDVVR